MTAEASNLLGWIESPNSRFAIAQMLDDNEVTGDDFIRAMAMLLVIETDAWLWEQAK